MMRVVPADLVDRPNRRSVGALFHDHSAFVWRVLRHHGVPDRDLEDACQEVFVVAQRREEELDASRGAVTTWLYAIAWRVASTYRRSTARRREVLGLPSDDSQSGDEGPERELVRNRQRELLTRLLLELDDEKRSVVMLYEIEGLSMREIADTLGCPLQTAYYRLQAAHRELRAALIRRRADEELR